MENMYDKLGDLLNEALEKGNIPSYKNTENTQRELPEEIRSILSVLKINSNTSLIPAGSSTLIEKNCNSYGFDWKEITFNYHELLKKLHPDTQSQESLYIIYNEKQLDINDLQLLYKKLEQFFSKVE